MVIAICSCGWINDNGICLHCFSIILELPRPYYSEARDFFRKIVVVEMNRPSLESIHDDKISAIIKSCWDHDPELRPKMCGKKNKSIILSTCDK